MRYWQRKRRTAILLFLSVVSVFQTACAPAPQAPEADRRVLEEVQRICQQKLVLGLESELYVTAKIRPGVQVTEAELEQVYREFFFHDDGRRRQTAYVYLNVYNPDGGFLFQLAFDPIANTMTRSDVEHY